MQMYLWTCPRCKCVFAMSLADGNPACPHCYNGIGASAADRAVDIDLDGTANQKIKALQGALYAAIDLLEPSEFTHHAAAYKRALPLLDRTPFR